MYKSPTHPICFKAAGAPAYILTIFAVLTVAFGLAITASSRANAEMRTVDKIARSIPAQIPEVVTGGTWKKGDQGGVYRAIVVMSGAKGKTAKNPRARVYIQWIAYEKDSFEPRVVETVSIREVDERQLRHAFLAMDTIKNNEMTLLVTSYDTDRDKDVSISVKATAPGKYASVLSGVK